MVMYKNAHELLEKEFPANILSHIYPFFTVGQSIYNDIISNYDTLFKSNMFINVRANLLNFVVCTQFEPDVIQANFPFKTRVFEVNNFKRKAIELRRNNVILHIAKSSGAFNIPHRSQYRKSFSQLNHFWAKQLLYDNELPEGQRLKEEPYYGIILFGGKNNTIEFVNLIIPNESMTGILDYIDLKNSFSLYENKDELLSMQEKQQTRIKNSIIEKLKLKGEVK